MDAERSHRAALEVEIRMQQIELSEQFRHVLQHSEKRVQTINYVLAFLLTVVLIWAMYAAWRSSKQEKITSIELVENSVKVLGPTSLCPGDTMTVRFALDIDGIGAFIIDDFVQHGTQTVKFSQAQRDYSPQSGRRVYELPWVIPEQPEMPANGNSEWVPGLHMRYVTVAASNAYVSRYTEPASFKVGLTILEDC